MPSVTVGMPIIPTLREIATIESGEQLHAETDAWVLERPKRKDNLRKTNKNLKNEQLVKPQKN